MRHVLSENQVAEGEKDFHLQTLENHQPFMVDRIGPDGGKVWFGPSALYVYNEAVDI